MAAAINKDENDLLFCSEEQMPDAKMDVTKLKAISTVIDDMQHGRSRLNSRMKKASALHHIQNEAPSVSTNISMIHDNDEYDKVFLRNLSTKHR